MCKVLSSSWTRPKHFRLKAQQSLDDCCHQSSCRVTSLVPHWWYVCCLSHVTRCITHICCLSRVGPRVLCAVLSQCMRCWWWCRLLVVIRCCRHWKDNMAHCMAVTMPCRMFATVGSCSSAGICFFVVFSSAFTHERLQPQLTAAISTAC